MQPKQITIDIVSDVMCPWCYIGKRRLEAALALLGRAVSADVHWRPYQLDPTLPKEGKDRRQYLEEKFGGYERARQAYEAVRAAGEEEDIAFDFEKIAVSANTLDAHRLIRWAGSQGSEAQTRMVSVLFRFYFEEGRNIGDDEVLLEAAKEAGLDPTIVAPLLSGEADRAAVEREIEVARQMGVTGVPCFIIDGRYAILGAQPAEAIADSIRRILESDDDADGPENRSASA